MCSVVNVSDYSSFHRRFSRIIERLERDIDNIYESFVSKGYVFSKLNDFAEKKDLNLNSACVKEEVDDISAKLFELNKKRKRKKRNRT